MLCSKQISLIPILCGLGMRLAADGLGMKLAGDGLGMNWRIMCQLILLLVGAEQSKVLIFQEEGRGGGR